MDGEGTLLPNFLIIVREAAGEARRFVLGGASVDLAELDDQGGVEDGGYFGCRCPKCGHDIFVALSCKIRGCPSCDAKRSAIITGQALERLPAFVPYRQWVLVVPKRLRYFLNHDPALAGGLSRIFAEEINHFLCQSATGTPAQLHFIQRFGGALNLRIHVHAVVSDGVFSLKMNVLGRSEVVFTPVPCPTDRQLAAIGRLMDTVPDTAPTQVL